MLLIVFVEHTSRGFENLKIKLHVLCTLVMTTQSQSCLLIVFQVAYH